jgi:Uma2 family endonuclease
MEAPNLALTIDDYYDFVDDPANEDRLFELIDGELVEKMPSWIPSLLAGWIQTYFNIYLLQNPIGAVTGEQGGFRLNRTNLLIPDVGYISYERLGAIPDREVLTAPDIAVEVKSPTDRLKALQRKAQKYLDAGTKIVWLVIPKDKAVEIYEQGQPMQKLGVNDTLTCGDILPGFTLRVADIFNKVMP